MCPAGFFQDPRPAFKGVCVPSKGGGMFSSVMQVAGLQLGGSTTLVPGSLVPSQGVPGAPAAALTTTSSVAGPVSKTRIALWVGIGGVVLTAGVLLLRRRR